MDSRLYILLGIASVIPIYLSYPILSYYILSLSIPSALSIPFVIIYLLAITYIPILISFYYIGLLLIHYTIYIDKKTSTILYSRRIPYINRNIKLPSFNSQDYIGGKYIHKETLVSTQLTLPLIM